MTPEEKAAYVYIQLPGSTAFVPAAKLTVQRTDLGFVGTFGYGRRYLERPGALALDPQDLPLSTEVFQFTEFQGVPRALLDAGPNAWGRRVIEAKLRVKPGDLWEIDYLLQGPEDGAGNLAFGRTPEPPGARRPYNRTIHLSDLMDAADRIAAEEPLPQEILEEIEPGTSMGGMRAKATVEDRGALWIAKFQERNDSWNIPRVEHATLELARACGLEVNASEVVEVAHRDVLLLRRFDREHVPGKAAKDRSDYFRHAYLSAHTLLRCPDSILDRGRWSYLLFADAVRRFSAKPAEDCLELYRRIVFNALVTNDDDHPRNHGLVRYAGGWRLSPAFDLLPAPRTGHTRLLAMTVGEAGREATRVNLLSASERYGLAREEAEKEIARIAEGVKKWRDVFSRSGVGAEDIEKVSEAFLPAGFFEAAA